jgi:hypothetical protein
MAKEVTEGKRGRGRPSGFTKDKVDHFLSLLKVGNAIHTAAIVAGLGAVPVTMRLEQGRRDRRDNRRTAAAQFLIKCEEATKGAEVSFLSVVAGSASGDTEKGVKPNPGDAKWMLAHLNRRRWGERLDVTHRGEQPIARAELANLFRAMMQVIAEEVEDDRTLLAIEKRFRELFRTSLVEVPGVTDTPPSYEAHDAEPPPLLAAGGSGNT